MVFIGYIGVDSQIMFHPIVQWPVCFSFAPSGYSKAWLIKYFSSDLAKQVDWLSCFLHLHVSSYPQGDVT